MKKTKTILTADHANKTDKQPKAEELVSCPNCGTANFTAKGLRAHRWGKRCQALAAGITASADKKTLAPVTLERLEAMPAFPPLRLQELSTEQLTLLAKGLHAAGEKAESFSGIAATLQGLVLIAVKKRLGHGNYMPWLSEHFGKSSKTAAKYVAVAAAFEKGTGFKFEDVAVLPLAADSDSAAVIQSLDLSHPTVAAVAQWTAGRTFYQLRQEEVSQGGNQHPQCPHCQGDLASKEQAICPHCGQKTEQEPKTPEQIKAELVEQTRERAASQMSEHWVTKQFWKLLPDNELLALAGHHKGLGKAIDEWVKTPARRREAMAIEEVLA